MAYYGQNVNAFLYYGASTATTLPAPGSDSFTAVSLVEVLTPPSNEQTTGSFNVLNDSNARTVGGKTAARTVDFTIALDWLDASHQVVEADSLVTGGQKRNWRIIYPDAGARQYDFVAFISKFSPQAFDATGDAKEHGAECTLTVDGAVTVTP
jgi:hypothetical protein